MLADRLPDPPPAPPGHARLADLWDPLQPLLVPLNQQLPAVGKELSGASESRLSACETLRNAARARRRLLAWGEGESVPFAPVNRLHLILEIPSEMARTLEDAAVPVRLNAVNALEAMGDDALSFQGAVAALLRKEADSQVRLAAVRTLKALANGWSSDEVIEALSRALADSDADVRQAAPAALVLYAGCGLRQESDGVLARAVKRDGGPRLAALQALSAIGQKAATAAPDVIAALDDADAGVRTAAAVALGRFGKPGDAARAALRKALDDPEPAVRLAAAAALLAGK